MADNTEETKRADSGASSEVSKLSDEQSFAYWLVMLPFLATAAVFIFDFSKTPGEYSKLINAAGAVVVGIFIASFVNILTQNSDNKQDENLSSAEAPKSEGSA